MMAIERKLAYTKVAELEAQLKVDDPRYRRTVIVRLADGSTLVHHRAFAVIWENNFIEWLFVFSQYHGYSVFELNREVGDMLQLGEPIPLEELPAETRSL